MAILSSDIIKLRGQTGAGMMDCKNALEEAGGNLDIAAELLRKKGIIRAAKRADKIAAEGMVAGFVSTAGTEGALVEVNSETDFVGTSADFILFGKRVAEQAVVSGADNLEKLLASKFSNGETVEQQLQQLTLKTGEKISLRRMVFFFAAESGRVGLYLHGNKIGVLVELAGGTPELAADIAMQVAASNPKYLDRTMVSTADLASEQDVYVAQLKQQGKPENIIQNIVKGKLEKYYGEVCLTEQPFIKNEEVTVEKLLVGAGARAVRFTRFELGEGIAKAASDFAAEVAAQL